MILFFRQKLGSSSGLVRLYPVTLESGGIYRCEVSNEFPDFDTVSRAEILSVVGEDMLDFSLILTLACSHPFRSPDLALSTPHRLTW